MTPALALEDLLPAIVPLGASDCHLRPGRPPILRVRGRLAPLDGWPALSAADIDALIRRLLSSADSLRLVQAGGVNLPYVLPGVGRFRLTVWYAQRAPYLSLRVLAPRIPTLEELGLPPVVSRLAMERRGLVLVTGPAGSGKSTTLAAMIHLMNLHRHDHIVTIEDPVEYVFENHQCLITQREVGLDAPSYNAALRLVLRQDPNVIVIGEMRDEETFQAVLALAQTGHLVLSTLHTGSVLETINRIIATFPERREASVRAQLAHALKGLIAQRLVPRADGTGLVPVTEILVTTGSVFRAILDPALTSRIPGILARGRDLFGTQTFDQCALDYFLRGLITEETALRAATSAMDFEVERRRLRKEQRMAASAAETRPEAQMEAILILEVVDVTRLLITHGDATFRDFIDRIEQRLAGIVKGFRARVLERHLDGFLITFPNVDWAVLALRAVFARLSEFNQLAEMEVAFRGALHYGSTWVDPQSQRVGAAVHKAFRVCAALDTPDLWGPVRPAQKNVVVATEEARDMLIPYRVDSRPLGAIPLKGFAGTHALYELAL